MYIIINWNNEKDYTKTFCINKFDYFPINTYKNKLTQGIQGMKQEITSYESKYLSVNNQKYTIYKIYNNWLKGNIFIRYIIIYIYIINWPKLFSW